MEKIIRKFLRVFLSFLFITSIFPFVSKVHAQAILVEDHFDDPNIGNRWDTHVGPQGYLVVEGGELEGSVVKESGTSDEFTYAIRGSLSWDNYVFAVRVKGVHGVDKKIMFRFQSENTRYDLNLISGSGLYFQRWLSGNSQILYFSPFQNSNDIWYELKVEANGNHFKIFVNNELKVDYIDTNSPLMVGKIGLQVWPGAYIGLGGRTTTRYDDISVTAIEEEPTPTPSPSPFLLVPDLKQFQDPWGDDEYNHALNWSVDPTMARWGCAVTSTSMILQYYGHTTNPGGLNTWLTSQPDGYLRNGITNWLAISRYTRIQNDENSVYPVLEYKRIHSATLETLSAELAASHPIILGQPGHFVVAKGETEDSFAINDPAYTDRPTLQSYGNTFTSFGRYTVTSTDLSAILLVSDSDTEISLFDSFGNPADADSFLAEPLTDDIDGTATSGNILQVLLFQQPSEGKYLIQVDEENGSFQLDVYLYDGEGNLIGGTPIEVSGLSQEGMPANFELNFDQDPNTPTITPETTFESTLQHLEISRNLGWISNQGIYQSLKSKLLAAQKAAGNNSRTKILTALLNELQALRGKQISEEAYDFLFQDTIYLLFS